MCGIGGFLASPSRPWGPDVDDIAAAMSSSLRNRGPDDQGIWTDPDAGAVIFNRRLSILDLSSAGHQPMVSADGRFVITYNGEVYSHRSIAGELTAGGHRFRGHSDTEVILESFAASGVLPTLTRLIGMFAIALWDRRDRTLTLIRDRLGIKPLYWAKFDGLFMFASELKALRAHPGWTPRIDRGAVAAFMRRSYIPAPHTIYQGVHKLEPGTILTLPWQGEPRLARFWDARAVARDGIRNPLRGSDAELTDQLDALIKDAVDLRMVADVPLGAFLSGGIDSSTVVALMQRAGADRVKTFSIGFANPEFNEAFHADAVARYLRTEHTELQVTPQQALDTIPHLPECYDEPFADASQIPTYLLSAMTRRHVTVTLSGDGGDELFAGYNRYRLAQRISLTLSLLPAPLRRGIAAGLTAVPPDRWTRLLSALPARRVPQHAGDKLHKLAAVLAGENADTIYRRLVSHGEPSDLMSRASEPPGILDDETVVTDFPVLLDRIQLLDLLTYLPDDILTKVDRASMAVGLETRIPFLDHRVVEFSWRLPRDAKLRRHVSKWILRQVLYRYVPPALVERPKMGFGIPLGQWLRGPLREWAQGLLNEHRLREAGLLDAAVVGRFWEEHIAGRRNWEHLLWNVLMLESWRERWAS